MGGTYYIEVFAHRYDGNHGNLINYEVSVDENTIPIGTYDDLADYLTDGFWEQSSGTSRRAFDLAPGGVLTANITALTEEGQQLARWALEAWANVTGIKFEFIDDGLANINFDDSQEGAYTVSGSRGVASFVNVSTDRLDQFGTTIDSYPFETYVHEIGHALGLGHPGPYNDQFVIYGVDNVFLIDSRQASMMSYFYQYSNTYINASDVLFVTPMIADIIAIQNLYGVPTDIRTGDTVYGYNSNVDGYLGEFFALWAGNEENPLAGLVLGWPGNPLGEHTTFTDLDSDNDLDLIIGSFSGDIHFYENTGTATNPAFTPRTDDDNPLDGVDVGLYSRTAFADLDDDSDFDLVIGTHDGRIHYFENTGTPADPNFTQRTGSANPLDGISTNETSTPVFIDLDGDGDFDLVVGGSSGGVYYFENIGTATNPAFTQRTDAANPLNDVNVESLSTPAFADLDGDGDPDLVIGERDGILHYFENTGSPDNPAFTQRSGAANPLDGVDVGHFSIPAFADLDGDGDPDLVSGNTRSAIHYFENTGTRTDPSFNTRSIERVVALTLYDNGGNDTLDLRRDGSDQRVDLNPEGISDVYGLVGNLVISRDTFIENFIAGFGNDVVIGNAAANRLVGGEGDDELRGNEGDDVLEGGAGADQLYGGAGQDWASYQGSDARITINLKDNTIEGGHAEGDLIVDIENVAGSGYGDVLTGDGQANQLDGGEGDDILEGGAGADRLDGGAGQDWASYQGSDAGITANLKDNTVAGGHAEGDVIIDIENVIGTAHPDTLVGDDGANELEGGAGGDELDGGAGVDWVSYAGSDGPVSVRLYDGLAQRGHAEGDTITGFENLRGSAHSDILAGTGRANRLEGGAGNDRVLGGSGDDVLEGGAGADRLYGGPGVDWISYQGSDAGVTVNLEDGTGLGGHAEGDVIVDIENVAGSGYGDVLTGDGQANQLDGSEGDDILEGSAGADRLDGGAGQDWASYQGSDAGITANLKDNTVAGGHAEGDVIIDIENVIGTAHPDTLVGDDGANELEGGAGGDELDGGAGVDWVSYAGSDGPVSVRLYDGLAQRGHAEGDTITGFENLRGSAHSDILAGTGRANRLEGGAGNDRVLGGSGDDVLEGGAGADRLYGGPGVDWISYQGSDAGVTVNLEDGTGLGGHAEGDVIVDIENVAGSGYGDVLTGDGQANQLDGSEGDDILEGGAGADRLDGGAGQDWASYQGSDAGITANLKDNTVAGGHAEGDVIIDIENVIGTAHPDTLIGDDGANKLEGGEGHDYLEGGAGADQLDGGAGQDQILYHRSDAGVTVNLEDGTGEGGHAEGDIFTGIESVIGSNHRDILIGDDGYNFLDGGSGDDELWGNDGGDTLAGSAGDDRLYGGEGNDYLYGRTGADLLDGGGGIDSISYNGSDAGVMINLMDDIVSGGSAEGDVIVNIENVQGSHHQDRLVGDDGDNTLTGIGGDDDLWGNGGDDELLGQNGDDMLDGGRGTDSLGGGRDADIFVFASGHGDDTILDFTNDEDIIDLTAFDLAGFDDLTLSSASNGVKIDLSVHDGGTILLQDFDLADLDAADFIF